MPRAVTSRWAWVARGGLAWARVVRGGLAWARVARGRRCMWSLAAATTRGARNASVRLHAEYPFADVSSVAEFRGWARRHDAAFDE
jgi:hypothetical protein